MAEEPLHISQVLVLRGEISASEMKSYYNLECLSQSGEPLVIRLPRSEAKKLLGLLQHLLE